MGGDADMVKKTAKKKPPLVREVLEEIEQPSKSSGSVKMTKVRVKQCAFCKHYYIKPCDDKSKSQCPNYLHLQSKIKQGKRK